MIILPIKYSKLQLDIIYVTLVVNSLGCLGDSVVTYFVRGGYLLYSAMDVYRSFVFMISNHNRDIVAFDPDSNDRDILFEADTSAVTIYCDPAYYKRSMIMIAHL